MTWTTTPPTEPGTYRLAEPGKPVEDVWVDHSFGVGPLVVYVRIGGSGGASLMSSRGPVSGVTPGARWMLAGPLPSAPGVG